MIDQTKDANAVIDINSLDLEQTKAKAKSYVQGIFDFSDVSTKSITAFYFELIPKEFFKYKLKLLFCIYNK